MDVEEWLAKRAAENGLRPEWLYRNFWDFILRHGQHWPICSSDPPYTGTAKQCFDNAQRLVAEDATLRYVEGVSYHQTVGHGVLHAWTITPHGTVLDNTPIEADAEACELLSARQYYGVVLDRDYVGHMFLVRPGHSRIDDWERRWPLLTDSRVRDWAIYGRQHGETHKQAMLPGMEGL